MTAPKNSVKCVITIPALLNDKIKIYQSKKAINIKRGAIIQMLSDFVKTKEGKALTS